MELQGGEEGYYEGVYQLHVQSGEAAYRDEAQEDSQVVRHCPRLLL